MTSFRGRGCLDRTLFTDQMVGPAAGRVSSRVSWGMQPTHSTFCTSRVYKESSPSPWSTSTRSVLQGRGGSAEKPAAEGSKTE